MRSQLYIRLAHFEVYAVFQYSLLSLTRHYSTLNIAICKYDSLVVSSSSLMLTSVQKMKVAIYGAAGFTGKLIVAELLRRKITIKLLGRNADALQAIADGNEVESVGLDAPVALSRALQGCDVVISCVAPYTDHGRPVLEAALSAACSYVDVSGEQLWAQTVYEDYGPLASQKGVTVVPAATDDGVSGDLLAGLLAKRTKNGLESLKLHHAYFDVVMSRGSLRSFLEFTKTPPRFLQDGKWQEGSTTPQPDVVFPATDGTQSTWLLSGPELPSIQRHVSCPLIVSTINMDLPTMLCTVTEEVVMSTPLGPTNEVRSSSRFTIFGQAVSKSGDIVEGYVRGNDIYKITAVMAVETAVRIVGNEVPKGAVAPSEAFKSAEEFLDALKDFGVEWHVQTDSAT